MNSSYNYIKPHWAPPSDVFAPVWSVLYALIFISLGIVTSNVARKEWPPSVLVPFIINLIFNLLYIPLQFGARSFTLATIDIVFVFGTAIWSAAAVYNYSKALFIAQIPHLLWLLFATILQFSLVIH